MGKDNVDLVCNFTDLSLAINKPTPKDTFWNTLSNIASKVTEATIRLFSTEDKAYEPFHLFDDMIKPILEEKAQDRLTNIQICKKIGDSSFKDLLSNATNLSNQEFLNNEAYVNSYCENFGNPSLVGENSNSTSNSSDV